MKKKTNIKTIIRQIVREEVAMAIQEVITELKQPSLSSQPVSQPKTQKKIVEKKTFSTNSVLNEILNETEQEGNWKTMGGETYDSSKVNEVMSSQYGDLMNSDSNEISVNGQTPDFLKKDYRQVLQKSIEKTEQKNGR